MRNEKIAILIKRAALVVEKISNNILAPYDLTNAQFKILMMLYKNPDQTVRQADIENRFSMTNPTVTGIIQNLEKKNLVQRVENPNDKRSKLLVLTPQAREMEQKMYELSERREKEVTSHWTKEECEQLIVLLNKLLD